jgi:DnaJ-class molecular chaperone
MKIRLAGRRGEALNRFWAGKTDAAHALAEMRGVRSQPAAPATEGAFDGFLRRAAEDCINGGDRTASRPAQNICVECEGASGNADCPDCHGTGVIE